MTKKTKTPRDRRRIATSRGYSDFDYKPLKVRDWNIVQDNLGVKIQPQLREQLSGITMIYAAAQMPRSTRPLSEVIQEIDLWRRQTEVLIKNVWASDLKTYKPNTKKLNLKQISETYFRFAQNIVTPNYPLVQLAHFLEGAVAVSNYFIGLLKDPQFKGERKTELWLVWAALIITCCRDSGIEVQKPNKNNGGIEVCSGCERRCLGQCGSSCRHSWRVCLLIEGQALTTRRPYRLGQCANSFDHHEPSGHRWAVPRRQSLRRQPPADARRVPRLSGSGGAQCR